MGKKIDCLRMEPADNGIIISYDEITETVRPGETYPNRDYKCRKEVFDFDADDDEDTELDKAMERFKQLMRAAVAGKQKSIPKAEDY